MFARGSTVGAVVRREFFVFYGIRSVGDMWVSAVSPADDGLRAARNTGAGCVDDELRLLIFGDFKLVNLRRSVSSPL